MVDDDYALAADQLSRLASFALFQVVLPDPACDAHGIDSEPQVSILTCGAGWASSVSGQPSTPSLKGRYRRSPSILR